MNRRNRKKILQMGTPGRHHPSKDARWLQYRSLGDWFYSEEIAAHCIRLQWRDGDFIEYRAVRRNER